MLTHIRRRTLIVGGVALLTLVAVSLVYAAWTTNGTGSGYAKAGEAQDLSTIDVSAQVSTLPNALYPGADGDVAIQVQNPNPFPVQVTQIAGDGPVTASGGNGTCTTTGVSLNGPLAVTIDVPASSSSAVTTLTDGAHMSSASDDGCQNATFAIPVTLTGSSGP